MKRVSVCAGIGLLLLFAACSPTTPVSQLPPTASRSTHTPSPAVTLTPLPVNTPIVDTLVTPPAVSVTPTATPVFNNFQVREWAATSPDGIWVAKTTVALPLGSQNQYYTHLSVSHTAEELVWIIEDAWQEWGLGYTIPHPLHWSRDGYHLYFTHRPVPDGCSVFVNGQDLYEFDLRRGSARELAPPVGFWLALSPDETQLAYIGFRNRGLVVRDLASAVERESVLDPGDSYQAGHIIWSPDGAGLVLTLALRPCTTDWADATSIMYVNTTTLEQTILIHEDNRLFITMAWASENQVLLHDKAGDSWLLDVITGQLSSP